MNSNPIPLAGVIGQPIMHSKSPSLHAHWLRKLGLRGYYIPMNVAPEDLKTVLELLPKIGFQGLNVTIPHKEAVLQLVDLVTDRAALIGAANTLIFRKDGKIHADNTDGHGFIANLAQYAPSWDPKTGPAAVIGAGGAARAIVSALVNAGTPEIRIANRTKPRAERLKADFGTRVVVYDWFQAGNMIEGVSTVVNATTLGMTGQPELRIPLDGLTRETLVTDVVYAPLETRLLAEAREIGCTTVDGLGMLLHQAAPGFERWFGMRPEIDDETRAFVLRQ